MLGALVLAARRLPPEVVEALVPAYEDRARDEIPNGDEPPTG